MLRLEMVLGERQIDRHEASPVAREPLPLGGQRPGQILRHRGRVGIRAKGIRQYVAEIDRRVSFVQHGLHHHQRPARVGLEDLGQRFQHAPLGVVQGLDDHDQAVRPILQHPHVFGRIVVGLTQAAGVEKLEKVLILLGERVELRSPRAGAKAVADLGAAAAGQGANDRRFPGLHLPRSQKTGSGNSWRHCRKRRLDSSSLTFGEATCFQRRPKKFPGSPIGVRASMRRKSAAEIRG